MCCHQKPSWECCGNLLKTMFVYNVLFTAVFILISLSPTLNLASLAIFLCYILNLTFISSPSLFTSSLFPIFILSISIYLRCSSCYCLAGRESCVCRSGMCPCLTRRGRRSPETWSRPYWPGSPRCAASWSGGISRLFTRGQ